MSDGYFLFEGYFKSSGRVNAQLDFTASRNVIVNRLIPRMIDDDKMYSFSLNKGLVDPKGSLTGDDIYFCRVSCPNIRVSKLFEIITVLDNDAIQNVHIVVQDELPYTAEVNVDNE